LIWGCDTQNVVRTCASSYISHVSDEARHLTELVTRLHVSMARTEREALGLHAALVEAVRRLHAVHQRTDDLKLALDNPGEAPLNWRHGHPTTRTHRSQEENAALYKKIWGED